jgi:hypothetical protein
VRRTCCYDLGLGSHPGAAEHIREYRNGKDITQANRDALVIDLFGLSEEESRVKVPAVYQHVLTHVKPERDTNNRETRKRNWWLFGETNPKLRDQLNGLRRFIATTETAKHRFFVFLDKSILPDNALVNIALDDAYALGVLSSRIHVDWALATGGTLEDRPRYNKTRCFETFPFPAATPGAAGEDPRAGRAVGCAPQAPASRAPRPYDDGCTMCWSASGSMVPGRHSPRQEASTHGVDRDALHPQGEEDLRARPGGHPAPIAR